MQLFPKSTCKKHFGGLDHGDRYEFCPYELKNVLVNGYFLNDWHTRKEMYENAKAEIAAGAPEVLMMDLIDLADPFTEEVRKTYLEKEAGLKKLEKPVKGPDEYLKHLYKDNYSKAEREFFEEDLKNMKEIDFRKITYCSYYCDDKEPGAIFEDITEETDLYRYDELFKAGRCMEYVTGDLVERTEGMTDDLCAGRALQTVFSGD